MGNRTGRDLPATIRAEIGNMILAISRKQFTQEQAMQEIARLCLDGLRDSIIEECAKACDQRFSPDDAICTREAQHCAKAIRSLSNSARSD